MSFLLFIAIFLFVLFISLKKGTQIVNSGEDKRFRQILQKTDIDFFHNLKGKYGLDMVSKPLETGEYEWRSSNSFQNIKFRISPYKNNGYIYHFIFVNAHALSSQICILKEDPATAEKLLSGYQLFSGKDFFGECADTLFCVAENKEFLSAFASNQNCKLAIQELVQSIPNFIFRSDCLMVRHEYPVHSVELLDKAFSSLSRIILAQPDVINTLNTLKRLPRQQQMQHQNSEKINTLNTNSINTILKTNPQTNSLPTAHENTEIKSQETTPVNPVPISSDEQKNIQAQEEIPTVPQDCNVQNEIIEILKQPLSLSETEKRVLEFAGRTIQWNGKLLSSMPYSIDYHFGNKGGIKTVFEIFEIQGKYGGKIKIKAVASFPKEMADTLKPMKNQKVIFAGDILKYDAVMHEIYITNAKILS